MDVCEGKVYTFEAEIKKVPAMTGPIGANG
jgi:hypothetical protein